MSRLILGLDLGESSIGGALIQVDDNDELEQVVWANSRVFSGVIHPQKKVTLNQQRRGHRGQRKTIERRVRRRKRVESALVRAGLLPEDTEARNMVLGRDNAKLDPKFLDPYSLRARAVTEKLEPFEIGRAIQHLLQRRGFRSNRKAKLADLLGPKSAFKDDEELQRWIRETQESVDADEGDESSDAVPSTGSESNADDGADSVEDADSDDPKKTLEAIESLYRRWQASKLPTIGAFLAKELDGGQKVRKRNRLSRVWLEDEFDAIWDAQRQFHNDLLTDKAKDGLRAAFEQRPLKPFRIKLPKRGWTGNDLEKELRMTKACGILGPSKPVSRRGHWVSQRYRIMETLRNLRLQVGDDMRPLTMEEVVPIAQKMQSTGSITWAALRKEIGIGNRGKFTIEGSEGSLKKLEGNRTERILKRMLAEKWDDSLELEPGIEREQLEFMQDVETCSDPLALFRMLQRPKRNGNRIYSLTKRQAFDLICESFSSETTNYSVKAMRTLNAAMMGGAMPHEAREAVKSNAQLKGGLQSLPAPPPLRNPRVQRCLYELRKVVNALIDCYGLPDVVKIEMGREMTENKKDREAHSKAIRENEAKNKASREWYTANGRQVFSRRDLDPHKLWRQQNELCPYCLISIGASQILNDEADIDHVLPLTKGGDDAFSNKVLAHRECNAEKSDRLPSDCWQGKDWDERLAFIKAMGNRALTRRFEMAEIPDGFVERQLKDTQYIVTEAVKYLEQLDIKGIPWGSTTLKVWPTNGRATGFLRRVWGLNGLLPKLETTKKITEAEKNRLDHRHHAVDAIVVALTTPARYRAALIAFRGERAGREMAKKQFYKPPVEDIKHVIESALTSHALNKGIRGALHDASYYGRMEFEGESIYVRRIPVDKLIKPKGTPSGHDFAKTKAFIEQNVYDSALKRALLERMQQGDWFQAFKSGKLQLLDAQGQRFVDANKKPCHVVSVRVKHKLTDKSMVNIDDQHRQLGELGRKSKRDRYVSPMGNHHGELIELANGSVDLRSVSMLDASRIMHSKERGPKSLYYASLGPDETPVLCLAEDEIVKYEGIYWRVAGVSDNELTLRDANDGRTGKEPGRVRLSSNRCRDIEGKFVVDALGNLTPYDGP